MSREPKTYRRNPVVSEIPRKPQGNLQDRIAEARARREKLLYETGPVNGARTPNRAQFRAAPVVPIIADPETTNVSGQHRAHVSANDPQKPLILEPSHRVTSLMRR